ncbi:MAG TPA: PHB depolymerase family esterase [Burkholderiaceae bacterium]|jgi:poly(3-hydroxybutyrate) depolymerase
MVQARSIPSLAGRTFGAAILFSCCLAAQAQSALQAYNADPASASVSGLSSGGFMAAQLGVAYSSTFQAGFGVFAGGPVDCARAQSYTSCMYNQTPSITGPNANLKSWSGTSNEDSTANLANRKIYLWTGSADTTVGPNVMNQLKSQLSTYYTAANVSYVTSSGAVHTFPTNFAGSGDNSCSSSVSPYISNCSYDGAGAVLQWMYGSLNAPNTGTLGGSVVSFDQTKFVASGNGMDTTGYLYVPASCASGSTACKVHVALHGCLQSHGSISMEFINNTGYNRWADTNNIIVLYPQAIADNSSHSTPGNGSLSNPNGCWDWVGWYGSNFDEKPGVQVTAIVKMVNQITSGFKGGTGGGGGGGGGTIPAAPTGLAVSGTTSSSVSLSWSASAGAASYSVFRNGVSVGTSTSTSYTDSGLNASTTYSYYVEAVNSAGSSSPSGTVSGTTQSSVPYSQAVTATVTNQYVAGRINVNQYLQLGQEYGYNANITLYLCGSTWTDSASCGPMF